MVIAKPTPDAMIKMPTPTPGMKDMRPGSNSSMDKDMGDDMMGTPGLVPPGIMVGMKGRWMVGYQVMFDSLKGKLVGTRHVSDATVLSRFETSPTDMSMQMHMFMVMYAPTNKLTLMAMLPFTNMSMGELHRDSTRATERSKGIGDLQLSGLYVLYARKDLRHRFLLNFGVGLPTGSINALDVAGERLEYPMQLGSGTFSVMPGFTYLGEAKPWGWGAEFIPTLRIGRNRNGYRVGNRYQPSIWVARTLAPWVSLSASFRGDILQNIKGVDPTQDPLDEPTKDPMLQGGRRIDLTFGVSIHPVKAGLKGNTFFVNAVRPVYQSLDGPQLQRRWGLQLGWQYEF